MSQISFRDVRLQLGGRTILDRVDLDIGGDLFIGVLGANGAGKTTLMRAILGLIRPGQGAITVLGRKARRGNAAIGYMPQLRAMPASGRLRGIDVLAASLHGGRLGLPIIGRAGRAELDRVLDLVDARELARRPLADMSGGERQRLLLAEALLGHPQLLLLDEPLISLDPAHQDEVVALVRAVQLRLGLTVLFSAHELNPLLGALDRVLYLGRGEAALGTVDEVITGPVLSRLYGAPIEVVRVKGRIFVMSGGHDMERAAHRHEHGDGHTHDHGHDHDDDHDHEQEGRLTDARL